VVDDRQDFGLLNTADRLGPLIVIDQHDLLAAGLQQVEAGNGADDTVFAVHNRITAETCGNHAFPDIVDKIFGLENHQLFGFHEDLDRHGLLGVADRIVWTHRRDQDRHAHLFRHFGNFRGWQFGEVLVFAGAQDNA